MSVVSVGAGAKPADRVKFKNTLARSSCLCGAAAAMLLIGAARASAQDACGALSGGAVVCDPSGGPYVDGVAYAIDAPAPPQDLTITLGDGLLIDTSGGDSVGVNIFNGAGGSVTVSGSGATISTSGAGGGVKVVATAGDVMVQVGDVATLGDHADAIAASTNYGGDQGGISISAGAVSTAGLGATGIRADSYIGDVDIKATSVVTTGEGSDAVAVFATYGNASVNIGDVITEGAGGRGITAYSQGLTSVVADNVYTFGEGDGQDFDAGAIKAVGTAVNVDVGTVRTSGSYAVGIYANTNHQFSDATIVHPDINVVADVVVTQGYRSDGIVAFNYSEGGATNVVVGRVSVSGETANGVSIGGLGDVSLKADSISTAGTSGNAVDAVSIGGDIAVAVGTIHTTGTGGYGVKAINYSQEGATTIQVGAIQTTRDYAAGVHAEGYGEVAVTVGQVSTNGLAATGVSAFSGFGDVDVHIDKVTTHGDDAVGILTTTYGGGRRLSPPMSPSRAIARLAFWPRAVAGSRSMPVT